MEDDEEPAMLVSVAEKALQQRCNPQTLTYCPSMDLVALVTEDEQFHVFRLNGQRVFGASYVSSNLRIFRLQWKPNGKPDVVPCHNLNSGGVVLDTLAGHLIAVAGSDNRLRLFSAYSGKVVHQLNSVTGPESRLSCLGWGVNFADPKATQKQLRDSNGEVSLDALLIPTLQPSGLQHLKTDLPRELALLDLETSLPKLSTLPSTGDEYDPVYDPICLELIAVIRNDVFSSRASIDGIFHSTKGNANESVDVLLAGYDNGAVHIRIFDCFDIGLVNIANSDVPSKTCNILYHISHPLTSTHAMLVADEVSQRQQLRLVTLDLRFIPNSGRYLSLLASKSTQLQNLLRYINQVQVHILQEWKTSQDLPAKFMRNINEELNEKHDCDFIMAAYHLLVTGDCSETMKEFLIDQVGERGHKRWEKAVVTGYEAIRRLTHECLLPALERCRVLLSRLQGLSKFQNSSQLLGLGTRQIADCLALVDCVTLLGHQLLLESGRELRQFVCFAKWLRQEIDIQAVDPTSSSTDDTAERSENMDYAQVLGYIQGAMTKSALLNFFRVSSNEPVLGLSTADGSGTSLYNGYKEAAEDGRKGFWAEGDHRVRLNELTLNLGARCQKVFAQIAETQKRSILVSSPLLLSEDCDPSMMGMKMSFDSSDHCSVHIGTRSRRFKSKIYMYRVVLEIFNGVSSVKEVSQTQLEFSSAIVKDFAFVDDDLMLLVSRDGSSYLAGVPLPESAEIALDIGDRGVRHQYVRHTFDTKRVPIRMEVNGRKGRRVVCILYDDLLHYTVFDLDSGGVGDAEEVGEEEQGKEDEEVEMIDVE